MEDLESVERSLTIFFILLTARGIIKFDYIDLFELKKVVFWKSKIFWRILLIWIPEQ